MKSAQDFKSRYEHLFPVAFFIGGVLLDVFTLNRIDSWAAIGQQLIYLALILFMLLQMFFEEDLEPNATLGKSQLTQFYYKYRILALHFSFGALLSCFSFFFFKSASLFSSFAFLLIMVVLLVANEFERVQNMGLPVKFGLFSLCSLCFFASVIPILIGRLGVSVFLLSMFAGCLPLTFVTLWIQSKREQLFLKCKKQILVPNALVLLLFLVLYLFKVIPPIPLSIPYMGVFHSVERNDEGFRLGHQNPWWKFWNSGDQNFKAMTGDKVYVFFRIFSPTNFTDEVLVRWYLKDVRRHWVLQDSIPIKILGGREDGFRGFGAKSNYQPGEWKVQVETEDGREIGRIYFDLELTPEAQRTFDYLIM